MEEARSLNRLRVEARNVISTVKTEMLNDSEELELLARVISEYEDMTSPDLWNIIDSYDTVGAISRLELLLPGDIILTTGGNQISSGGNLSFEKEAAQGAHISDREADLVSEGEYVVRNYVPVMRGEETVAMLCGVVELGALPEEITFAPYGNKAAIYIIDAGTGNFLMDTWHNKPEGNIWQLGKREMAPGYDHEQLKQGMINGETGYVVFASETIGEYLYFYYEPIGINRWQLALSVPESVVFESAYFIRYILNIFLVSEGVCLVLYFFWMLHYVRRETSAKQRQLDTIQYIYDVEKLLFNAHEQSENVTTALSKVAEMTRAECVILWISGDCGVKDCYRWCRDGSRTPPDEAAEERFFRGLMRYFAGGTGELIARNAAELKQKLPGVETEKEKICLLSLIAVPVPEMSGGACGVLACFGVPGREMEPGLLRNVDFSFSMFCYNLRSYDMIRLQGEMDILSGLLNRNRYEKDLPVYKEKYKTSLACIYIDVNGLHELNNSRGHEAGDRLIRVVAAHICAAYGEEHTYRIGGDEFVAIAVDQDRKAVYDKCSEIEYNLRQKGIHISAGIQWEEQVDSVDTLIKAAEKKMYQAKRVFYQQAAHGRRNRERIDFDLDKGENDHEDEDSE